MKKSTREKTTPSYVRHFKQKLDYVKEKLIKTNYGYHDEVAFDLLINLTYNMNYLEFMPYLLIFLIFMHLIKCQK